MIKVMMGDLRVFIWLMLVFLLSQGVILQSLENPRRDLPNNFHDIGQQFYGIVYKPYFQIYGELFVEDMSNEGKVGLNTIFICLD